MAVSRITAKDIHLFDKTKLAFCSYISGHLSPSSRLVERPERDKRCRRLHYGFQVVCNLCQINTFLARRYCQHFWSSPRKQQASVQSDPVLLSVIICEGLLSAVKNWISWQPQRQYLALIGLGNGRALASWGAFTSAGSQSGGN